MGGCGVKQSHKVQVGSNRREGEKPCGRTVSERKTGTTITWTAFAEGNRTPWKVSSFSRCVSRATTPPRWNATARQPSVSPPDRLNHFGGDSQTERPRRATPRRSPLRRRSTTRSTRNFLTSVKKSRSSRRRHSPVTPPSGRATRHPTLG